MWQQLVKFGVNFDPNYYNNQSFSTTVFDPAAFFDIVFGIILAIVAIIIVVYVVFALSLYKIAKRTKTQDPFLAWIPIVNIYLMTQIAKRPAWWIVLMLIPIVNIVVNVLLWMDISKRMGKPDWWGVIIGIVPIVNLIMILMLAFGDYKLTKIPDRR